MTDHRNLIVVPLSECEPEIGRMLWMLADCRQRTRTVLAALHPAAIDWVGGVNGHSIGTLLYHLAAIELDWLATEVTEGNLPASIWSHFPFDVRDSQGQLTAVRGIPLEDHWQRLDRVRNLLQDTFKPMTLADFRRPRVLDDYDVTPEWVLHHLMQHEAGHRDELEALRRLAEADLKSN